MDIWLDVGIVIKSAPSRNRTGILPSGGECTIHYAMGAITIIYIVMAAVASQKKILAAQ